MAGRGEAVRVAREQVLGNAVGLLTPGPMSGVPGQVL